MEILILIIGLFMFFETDSKDINTTKKMDIEQVISQETIFEIVNVNGTWVFAPIKPMVNKKEATKKQLKVKELGFITLPNGSKIEKGL